jgi:hypothetical protein
MKRCRYGSKKVKNKTICFILFLFITPNVFSSSQPAIAKDDTAHYDFENVSLCPIPIYSLEKLSNQIFWYVFKRMNASLNTTINVTFKSQPEGTIDRGNWSPGLITIFVKENVTQDYILSVLAHETGHEAMESRIGRSQYRYQIDNNS